MSKVYDDFVAALAARARVVSGNRSRLLRGEPAKPLPPKPARPLVPIGYGPDGSYWGRLADDDPANLPEGCTLKMEPAGW